MEEGGEGTPFWSKQTIDSQQELRKMHAKSFRIFYKRISPYGSIMCEDFPANLLIPKMGQGGGGAKQYIILI